MRSTCLGMLPTAPHAQPYPFALFMPLPASVMRISFVVAAVPVGVGDRVVVVAAHLVEVAESREAGHAVHQPQHRRLPLQLPRDIDCHRPAAVAHVLAQERAAKLLARGLMELGEHRRVWHAQLHMRTLRQRRGLAASLLGPAQRGGHRRLLLCSLLDERPCSAAAMQVVHELDGA